MPLVHTCCPHDPPAALAQCVTPGLQLGPPLHDAGVVQPETKWPESFSGKLNCWHFDDGLDHGKILVQENHILDTISLLYWSPCI